MAPASRFDLVAVAYDTPTETRAFWESLDVLDPETPFRITLVDNSPGGEVVEALADVTWPRGAEHVRIARRPDNPGYPNTCNEYAFGGPGAFVGVLNTDVLFTQPDTLTKLADGFDADPELGVQGPFQAASDGNLLHTGWVWSPDGQHQSQRATGWDDGVSWRDVRAVEMVTGSALFARRRMWEDLSRCPLYREMWPTAAGPLLPVQHYFDDSWVCAHAHAHGWRILYRGDIEMVHEYHRSHEEGGEYDRKAWATARPAFERTMAHHGISTHRGDGSLS